MSVNREAHTAGAVAYPHGDHLRAAVRRGAATFEGSVAISRHGFDKIIWPGTVFDRSGTARERFERGTAVGTQLGSVIGSALMRFLAAWGPPDTQADYARMEAP